MEVFIKLIVVLATYLEEDNVLLSVFQPYLIHANSCRVSQCQWTADTVDQILTEGDAMYVKAFDDGTIPDTETGIVADAFTRPITLAYGYC